MECDFFFEISKHLIKQCGTIAKRLDNTMRYLLHYNVTHHTASVTKRTLRPFYDQPNRISEQAILVEIDHLH